MKEEKKEEKEKGRGLSALEISLGTGYRPGDSENGMAMRAMDQKARGWRGGWGGEAKKMREWRLGRKQPEKHTKKYIFVYLCFFFFCSPPPHFPA